MTAKRKKKKSARSLLEAIEPALIPLCELFAEIDEIFAEEGAFDPNHIHKSLGRTYRAWLKARTSLDPNFDPERYRLDQKERNKVRKKPVRIGLSVQPVSDSPRRSTARTSISEQSPKKTARPAKSSAPKSASRVRSSGSASSGRSPKKSRSGSGAG